MGITLFVSVCVGVCAFMSVLVCISMSSVCVCVCTCVFMSVLVCVCVVFFGLFVCLRCAFACVGV